MATKQTNKTSETTKKKKVAKKTLVIVESPAKAKSINKALGSRYVVKSSMGHVIDLPKSKMGVDIEQDFEPQYITIRGKGPLLKELKDAHKRAGRTLLATDPDREGEAIAWHLQRALGIDRDESCRIVFNEITQNVIREAVKEPRNIEENKVDAQQARRVLDRLVGYSLSPLLWKKVKKGLSAGRVQSVAVRIICEREDEIESFVPEEYWTLDGRFQHGKEAFDAKLNRIDGKKAELSSEEEMNSVLTLLEGARYQAKDVRKKEKKKNPYAPYTTSSLQQDASRKLNFTARKTMRTAQQLYEGIDLGKANGGTVGLITYIRTDSTRVSPTAVEEVRTYITDEFGPEYLPAKPAQYGSKKNIQDAHEAIRPSMPAKSPDALKEYLSRDQHRLYRLIWERFVASQMAPAVMAATTIDIEAVSGKGSAMFRANGSVIKFPGYLKVDREALKTAREGIVLPEVSQGDPLELEALNPNQHFTQPPARYSEATLVKTLEELGIGRPSTYAPTIDTIMRRGYVVKEQKQFHSTELGRIVVELIKENFTDVIDPAFTAEMESRLDRIEEEELEWKDVIRSFYEPFSRELKTAEEKISKVELEEEVSDEVCEKCGRQMVVKMGRYGKFLACPGFPECRNTKPIIVSTGVKCPKCEGEVVEKKTRTGRTFYGCSLYPDCDFVSWDLPLAQPCPKCTYPLGQKTKRFGGYKYCLNEDCDYSEKKPSKKKRAEDKE